MLSRASQSKPAPTLVNRSRNPCVLAYINKVNTDIRIHDRRRGKEGKYIDYVDEFVGFASLYVAACDKGCSVDVDL